MTTEHAPKPNPQPERSFRIELKLTRPHPRIDQVLLEALRAQEGNHYLRNISRSEFKELFNKKRIRIKGQPARPSSSVAAGITQIDIMGYDQHTDHAR